MLYKNEYSLACNAAVKTKDFLKENFEMDAKLISNSEKDIKTFADLESEKLIISILQRTDIPIISAIVRFMFSMFSRISTDLSLKVCHFLKCVAKF